MRTMRTCVALLIAVGVIGCGAIAIRKAMEEANRINLDCREQKIQGKLATWSEAVTCSNDRVRSVVQASGYPHMDLIGLLLAYRVLLAERMDAGQLTDAEATVLFAELHTRLTQEEQARTLAVSHAHSQRLMGIGAAMQGFGALNQSLQPPPLQPPLVVIPLRR